MKKEIEYTTTTDSTHIKEYGQYFTNYNVAKFMAAWVSTDAKKLLDPAAGNSVFLKYAKVFNPDCSLFGYEIDPHILNFFGNPSNASLRNEDYLMTGWEEKYDAIICNPPYNRFQAIANRTEIIELIEKYTGIRYSRYTNLYILFLLKSLHQLSEKGKLAYIIPTEFLNSKYGIPIKEKLVNEKLLRAIINFKNDQDMFFNATTTCCILLIDKEKKSDVQFYNLDSISQLSDVNLRNASGCYSVPYKDLSPEKKWLEYIRQEQASEYCNLKQISEFCKITRGIATGANDFFCLSKSKIAIHNLPDTVIDECICRSADVKRNIFTHEDFVKLADADKTVFLLNIKSTDNIAIKEYITNGEEKELNKKYLLSCRNPWYSMEQKPIAPIWVSSACRNKIRFIRNIAGVKSLTTFHSIFINQSYKDEIDIIFCYFLTPIAQKIIRQNRKVLGNGLEKFQPNDIKTAKMLDITVLSDEDKKRIINIYHMMLDEPNDSYIESLNEIFEKYLCA